jgi:hypothetical protein
VYSPLPPLFLMLVTGLYSASAFPRLIKGDPRRAAPLLPDGGYRKEKPARGGNPGTTYEPALLGGKYSA